MGSPINSLTRFVSRNVPAPLLRLGLELSGSCSVLDVSEYGAAVPLLPSAVAGAAHYLLIGSRLGRPAHRLFDQEFYLNSSPDLRHSWWPPLLHYVGFGGNEGRNPHPLFDSAWYLLTYPEVVEARLNPLQHYLHFGAAEGRSPHPLFDGTYYLNQLGRPKNLNPLVHYLREGAAAGLDPHPLFDTSYYVERYIEVRASGLNPLIHYLSVGSAAGYRPHPLFDPVHYLQHCPSARTAGQNPLLHFLLHGGQNGISPHPLFRSSYYLELYPQLKQWGWNPLVHYLLHGGFEGRSPHPLFDSSFYMDYQQVRASKMNPLLHYLRVGAQAGLNPHPLFDTHYYCTTAGAQLSGGLTPLEHFVHFGWQQGHDPNPAFNVHYYLEHNPEVASSSFDPLSHYAIFGRPVRKRAHPHVGPEATARGGVALTLQPCDPAPFQPWRNSTLSSTTDIPVFVVYGPSNVTFLSQVLIPALSAQRLPQRVSLHLVNYAAANSLITSEYNRSHHGLQLYDWSDGRTSGHWGFGEGMNHLFAKVQPAECFFMINPDSFPMPDCLRRLTFAYQEEQAAIVEARQWPQEHPKEFDQTTGHTPWATGAFLLMSSAAFRELDGFDPIYFLYNEDVDLSWRAWLHGMPIFYERSASCSHFTGLYSYRPGRFYNEDFYSLRNFLTISYKFFGEEGERLAREQLQHHRLPDGFLTAIEESYASIRPRIKRYTGPVGEYAHYVKIQGLNRFHQVRPV